MRCQQWLSIVRPFPFGQHQKERGLWGQECIPGHEIIFVQHMLKRGGNSVWQMGEYVFLWRSPSPSHLNQLLCNLHDLWIEFSACLERRLLKRLTTVALSDLASRTYARVESNCSKRRTIHVSYFKINRFDELNSTFALGLIVLFPTVTFEDVCWGIRNVKSLIKVFYNMCCFVMFVTAVCILFLGHFFSKWCTKSKGLELGAKPRLRELCVVPPPPDTPCWFPTW